MPHKYSVVLVHEAIWCGCWSISLQAPILTGADGISQWKTEVDGHEHCTTFKKNSRDPRGSVIPDLSLSLLRHLQLTRAKGVQHTMTISYNHFQPLKTEPEEASQRLSASLHPNNHNPWSQLDPLQTGMRTQGLLDSCQHKGTRQNWVASKLHCRYK